MTYTKKIRIRILLFIILAAINLLIFLRRNDFQYISHSSYAELYSQCNNTCNVKWRNSALSVASLSDLEEASAILKKETFISTKRNTLDRVLTIANFIYSKFHLQTGLPSESFNALLPFQQYKKLTADRKEQLWCGHFTALMVLFCASQKITCRYIEIFNAGDHHVVAECYIPENKSWVMCDITNNILLTKKENIFLDTKSFRNAVQTRKTVQRWTSVKDTVEKEIFTPNTSASEKYFRSDNDFYYYTNLNSRSIYASKEKIRRYFLPVSWYEIYSVKQRSNLPFYIKQIFVTAFVMVFISIIYFLFKK